MTKEELDIQKEIGKYFTESTGFGRDKIANFMDIVNKALKQKGERIEELENKITDLNMKIDGLEEQNSYMFNEIALQEQQIEKMKRHCNCKHRDSEGYCEVKRTYLIDLSYDGCDKWELED